MRLSKANRVLTLIALMAAASIIVLGLVFVIASGVAGETKADLTRLTDMRIHDQQLGQAVDDEEAGLDDYVLSGDPTALRRFHESVALEAGLVAWLRDGASDAPISGRPRCDGEGEPRLAKRGGRAGHRRGRRR